MTRWYRAYEGTCTHPKLAAAEQRLSANPYFSALHDTAYARFLVAYEAL